MSRFQVIAACELVQIHLLETPAQHVTVALMMEVLKGIPCPKMNMEKVLEKEVQVKTNEIVNSHGVTCDKYEQKLNEAVM